MCYFTRWFNNLKRQLEFFFVFPDNYQETKHLDTIRSGSDVYREPVFAEIMLS